MNPSPMIVQAVLQPDGKTLHLDQPRALPPGRVTVTVESTRARSGPTMLEVLDRIRREQQQRGCKPMPEAEMATEIEQLRSEDEQYEERQRAIWSQTRGPDQRPPLEQLS